MKCEREAINRRQPSPLFSKTAREWILSSALYDGIEDEDIRQIETLLTEKGANPNTLLPEYGIAPFHMVVANEHTSFAVNATDICLQHGADPNVRSEDGLTPVHLAAMWGCPEVLHVLLASGGNPWLVDCLNKNAFDYALSEGQDECYNILKMYYNSEPKRSGHSKSPYHLNLKRVVLYKNDLQIVYEASPSASSSQKCVSTQTSPTILFSNECKGTQNGIDVLPTELPEEKNHSRIINGKNVFSFSTNNSTHNEVGKIKDKDTSNTKGSYPLSNKLKEIIVNHRRNSITFEYSPPLVAEEPEESSGVVSWKDTLSGNNVVSSLASDLMEKLEKTNKVRQSMKISNDKEGDILKNITHRKNGTHNPVSLKELECSTLENKRFGNVASHNADHRRFPLTQNSSSQFPLSQSEIGVSMSVSNENLHKSNFTSQYSQYSPPTNEIGFVLNSSVANSTILSRRNMTNHELIPESPPSIGFILDNLDESAPQTRGSSLFSDIDSDIEVCTTPKHEVNDNGISVTEDESASERKQSKYSSLNSLDPYVTCENVNTREWSSREGFESCMERLSGSYEEAFLKSKKDSQSKIYQTVNESSTVKDANSITDSVLNMVDDDDENKKTPVNRKIVTSTPERRCSASDQACCSQTANSSTSELGKRTWIEATISSSSDEDLYMSVSEEYEYTDMDEGVVLIERRYLKNDLKLSDKNVKQKSQVPNSGSEESEVSAISRSEGAYDTDELRQALNDHGFPPGPINGNTKRVYLRQLKRCRRKPDLPPPIGQPGERLHQHD